MLYKTHIYPTQDELDRTLNSYLIQTCKQQIITSSTRTPPPPHLLKYIAHLKFCATHLSLFHVRWTNFNQEHMLEKKSFKIGFPLSGNNLLKTINFLPQTPNQCLHSLRWTAGRNKTTDQLFHIIPDSAGFANTPCCCAQRMWNSHGYNSWLS